MVWSLMAPSISFTFQGGEPGPAAEAGQRLPLGDSCDQWLYSMAIIGGIPLIPHLQTHPRGLETDSFPIFFKAILGA